MKAKLPSGLGVASETLSTPSSLPMAPAVSVTWTRGLPDFLMSATTTIGELYPCP